MKKKFLLTLILITINILILGIVSTSAETVGIYTYSVSDGKATITGYSGTVPSKISIPATLGGIL